MSLIVLVSIFAIGTAGYVVIEDKPVFDAAYMTAITISTVGYRETFELDDNGKFWTLFVILFGVGGGSFALTSMVSVFVGGDLRDLIGRRKLQTQIEKIKDHVILCGYGRMGILTHEGLKERGVPVVVIESDALVCEKLVELGVPHVRGDAIDDESLEQAGLMKCKALVAALPSDADNVYVTLTARGMRPEINIIARAEQPSTESKLLRAGATRVICPQVVGATRITNLLTRPNIIDFVEGVTTGISLEMDEYAVEPGSAMLGKTLRSTAIRESADASVVAIKRSDGTTIYHPDGDEGIRSGDVLILVGKTGVSTRLQTLHG